MFTIPVLKIPVEWLFQVIKIVLSRSNTFLVIFKKNPTRVELLYIKQNDCKFFVKVIYSKEATNDALPGMNETSKLIW